MRQSQQLHSFEQVISAAEGWSGNIERTQRNGATRSDSESSGGGGGEEGRRERERTGGAAVTFCRELSALGEPSPSFRCSAGPGPAREERAGGGAGGRPGRQRQHGHGKVKRKPPGRTGAAAIPGRRVMDPGARRAPRRRPWGVVPGLEKRRTRLAMTCFSQGRLAPERPDPWRSRSRSRKTLGSSERK